MLKTLRFTERVTIGNEYTEVGGLVEEKKN